MVAAAGLTMSGMTPSGPASAAGPIVGTVAVSGTTLAFDAASGFANQVDMGSGGIPNPVEIVVEDLAGQLAVGTGCHLISGNTKARCKAPPGSTFTFIDVELGNGNDTVVFDPSLGGSNMLVPTRVFGQAGADELHGTSRNDTIDGGFGNDTLFGEQGADTVRGGPNQDEVAGGVGKDILDGGINADTMFAVDFEKDQVTCGDGLFDGPDTAHVDAIDTVDPSDCELLAT